MPEYAIGGFVPKRTRLAKAVLAADVGKCTHCRSLRLRREEIAGKSAAFRVAESTRRRVIAEAIKTGRGPTDAHPIRVVLVRSGERIIFQNRRSERQNGRDERPAPSGREPDCEV